MTEATITGVAEANVIKPAGAAAPEAVVVTAVSELEAAKKQAVADAAEMLAIKAELAGLKAAAVPAKVVQNQEDDLHTIIFTDPATAIKRLKAEISAEIRGEMEVGKAREQFWVDFYAENPGLKDADVMTKAVMAREYAAMSPLTIEKAREYLAEATQKELLKLGVKREKGKSKPLAEGGNERSAKPSKPTEGERPLTGGLSGVLKERAAARREEAAKSS